MLEIFTILASTITYGLLQIRSGLSSMPAQITYWPYP